MKLKEKAAVVTGGGSGIGLAIAKALAEEGCRVVIAGRGESRLNEAVAGQRSGEPLLAHTVDVADRQSVSELFRFALNELGRLDILVSAAGINVPHRLMQDLNPDDWDRVIDINATGTYNCIHAALPSLVEQPGGLIVNICSIAGKRAGLLGGVAYNASKFAQSALGITVSAEFGERGLRVTNIYPGEVNTPILQQRPVPLSAEHLASILQPNDVANAVLMVACLPARAHIPELVIKPTGQTYV